MGAEEYVSYVFVAVLRQWDMYGGGMIVEEFETCRGAANFAATMLEADPTVEGFEIRRYVDDRPTCHKSQTLEKQTMKEPTLDS
jgi:hypothetical protein